MKQTIDLTEWRELELMLINKGIDYRIWFEENNGKTEMIINIETIGILAPEGE